jgi:hypothetical protein
MKTLSEMGVIIAWTRFVPVSGTNWKMGVWVRPAVRVPLREAGVLRNTYEGEAPREPTNWY